MNLIQHIFISPKLQGPQNPTQPRNSGLWKGLKKMTDCVWVENIPPPESCNTWAQAVFPIVRLTWSYITQKKGTQLVETPVPLGSADLYREVKLRTLIPGKNPTTRWASRSGMLGAATVKVMVVT